MPLGVESTGRNATVEQVGGVVEGRARAEHVEPGERCGIGTSEEMRAGSGLLESPPDLRDGIVSRPEPDLLRTLEDREQLARLPCRAEPGRPGGLVGSLLVEPT